MLTRGQKRFSRMYSCQIILFNSRQIIKRLKFGCGLSEEDRGDKKSQMVYNMNRKQKQIQMHFQENKDQDIKEIVMRFLSEKEQWSKHVAHVCQKCEKCTCGKHKCKLHPVKIGLRPTTSTYHDSFQKRDFLKNQKIVKPNKLYSPSQFVKKSEYREEYDRKKNQTQKQKQIKGKPNIDVGGPGFMNTTYQQTFTPKNQEKRAPIKNSPNIGTLGLKMKTVSSYRDTFKMPKKMAVTKPIRRQDNLKTEQDINFMGRSNYNWSFGDSPGFKKNPEIDNFAPDRQYRSVQGVRQKTSYQNDFTGKGGNMCPAAYL